MRRSLICFLILLLALPTLAWAKEKPLKVGVLLPLTGSQAKFGEMEKNAFTLAMDEINAAGGVNGRMLEFQFEDDTGKPDVGRLGIEKLISVNKVPLVLGGYSSSVTFAAAQVAQRFRTPFVVCTGSVDKITEPEAFDMTPDQADRFYIYRVNPPVSEYASGLEGFLGEVVKPGSAIIFHENTTFGTSGAESFEKTCAAMGVDVMEVASYAAGTVDFKPLLLKVKEQKPDLVYMISYVMDAALLMKQARELGLDPKLFVGAGAGYTMPAFKENAGVASEKVISATLWHQSLPLEGAQSFFDRYVERFGGEGPDYHGAEAYATAYVAADALKRAKKIDTESIKKALDETDMMTVFGPVKFTAYGNKIHQNKMDTYVVQWIDGELKLIWPKALANSPYAYPIDWAKTWN
ncbi:MAG: ABC transporter substrate-binding protein [Candidatus Krumholzibacteriia bacterium]|nr:ABC transporter substrate-binding protein [bacterium]MCB9513652.1 ABC transporter substrate-binding protein [Candidatus Latescibacterota bacterium]MCB9515505.1 ABC transporter substrate-binding protein [Candidatus Latescibacterota bacterium]